MDTLERVLRSHVFLRGLNDEQIRFMVGCATNVVFPPGALLFRDGEEGAALFLIRAGRVGLEIDVPPGGRRLVETVESGDIIGWSWMFPPHCWHTDGRARDRVRAIRFDGPCLLAKLREDTDLGFAVATKLLESAHRRLERVRLQQIDAFGERLS